MRRFVPVLWLALSSTALTVALSADPAALSKQPRLKSIYSGVHALSEFVGADSQGLVLVFIGTECPVARQYLPRLKELYAQYRTRGISFIAIYSDVGVNVSRMAQHAHDEDIPFPVLQDADHRLADALEVQRTPEVVVLDRRLERKYQGAIDDQYSPHGRRPAASEEYLAAALASLLKGEPIEKSYIPAAGCPLERNAPKREPRQLTYYKDIAPLVQGHCQECHRKGGPGPFELISFEDVAYNSEKIREVVIDRRMPPWHGYLSPEFGKLANDQRLSADQIETIVDWIDAGAFAGNKTDAPPAVNWPAFGTWAIGKPDFVYRIPEPFRVPKSGTLEYQFFRVRLDLEQDRWFRGVEVKPGNPEVVHHISLHLAPSTNNKQLNDLAAMVQLYGLNGERNRAINDFVPGDSYNSKIYPPDQAVRIPKHTDLIFEVHYTPNNRAATTDQSMVGFQWADQPPEHEVLTTVFRKPIGGFRVPPFESHYRVEDTYYFEHDVEIDGIRPHFHYPRRLVSPGTD
jgi:peroxiredoxin